MVLMNLVRLEVVQADSSRDLLEELLIALHKNEPIALQLRGWKTLIRYCDGSVTGRVLSVRRDEERFMVEVEFEVTDADWDAPLQITWNALEGNPVFFFGRREGTKVWEYYHQPKKGGVELAVMGS